jgi:hypothetical protein
MRHIIIIIGGLILVGGCLPIPPPEFNSPSYLLRNIEGNVPEWLKLKGEFDGYGIGFRCRSPNTLVKFNNRFFLVNGGYIEIFNLDGEKKYKETLMIPPGSEVENYSSRLIDLSNGKTYDLIGYYINIDKIFKEKKWSKFILIDDCSVHGGMYFIRDTEDFISYNFYGNKFLNIYKSYYVDKREELFSEL